MRPGGSNLFRNPGAVPEAGGGQILTNQRTLSKIDEAVEAEPLGDLTLKGFSRPVPAFNIVGLK